MTKPASPDGYILSELEVYGKGGMTVQPHAATVADASGRSAEAYSQRLLTDVDVF